MSKREEAIARLLASSERARRLINRSLGLEPDGHYTRDEILAAVTDKNAHPEIDCGPDVGKERGERGSTMKIDEIITQLEGLAGATAGENAHIKADELLIAALRWCARPDLDRVPRDKIERVIQAWEEVEKWYA